MDEAGRFLDDELGDIQYLNLRGFSKHRNLTELQMQEKNRRSKNERGFLCRFFVSFTCETSFFLFVS